MPSFARFSLPDSRTRRQPFVHVHDRDRSRRLTAWLRLTNWAGRGCAGVWIGNGTLCRLANQQRDIFPPKGESLMPDQAVPKEAHCKVRLMLTKALGKLRSSARAGKRKSSFCRLRCGIVWRHFRAVRRRLEACSQTHGAGGGGRRVDHAEERQAGSGLS